jgi:hypothetical protein
LIWNKDPRIKLKIEKKNKFRIITLRSNLLFSNLTALMQIIITINDFNPSALENALAFIPSDIYFIALPKFLLSNNFR